MDTMPRPAHRPLLVVLAAALVAAALTIGPAEALADPLEGPTGTVALAVGEHERRPIAPTQRDQLGLVLYGFMAFLVLAGGATLRRQLKGERPQSDGEFRWR
jgi:hypothetical protein